MASPEPAPQSRRLARCFWWFGHRLGFKRTAMRNQHAGFGESLQLRIAYTQLAKHLSVVLTLERWCADRRQLIP
jgi:hypothetical protein